MEIKQTILDKNSCYVEALPLEVKGLLLHSVGCPVPKAMSFISTWNPPKNRIVCVHAFIDAYDGIIYQTLPWDMRARHSGGSANTTHIGVEMCEPACIKYVTNFTFECSDIDLAREQVTRVYNVAVELFAYLCDKYSLDPLGENVIISHREAYYRGLGSGHFDPEHLWDGLNMGYTMDGFRQDVKKGLDARIWEK